MISRARMWPGLILTTLGVLFLLDTLHMIRFGEFMSRWWPSILILVALYHIAVRGRWRWGWAIALLVVGVIFQVDALHLFSWWSAELVWPIALITAGVWLLVGRLHPRAPQASAETTTAAAVEGSATLDATAVFSDFKCVVTSKQFRGGAATSIFGGIKIDLRQAELAPGEQRLDITSVFSGAEVRVPPSWNVIVEGTPVLGHIKDARWPAGAAPPGAGSGGSSLRIRVSAIFGGMKVDT